MASALRRVLVAGPSSVLRPYPVANVASRRAFATTSHLWRGAQGKKEAKRPRFSDWAEFDHDKKLPRSNFRQGNGKGHGPPRAAHLFTPRPWEERPAKAPSYALPKPPPDAFVASEFSATLDSFAKDPYVMNRLHNVGICGPAAQEILSRLSGDASATPPEGMQVASQLLKRWSRRRAEVMTGQDENSVGDRAAFVEQARALISPSLDMTESDGDSFRRSALDNLHMRDFLTWVQAQLQQIRASIPPQEQNEPLAQSVRTLQAALQSLRSQTSLAAAPSLYPLARQRKRTIILHVGPTNSGKTHGALCRLVQARTGVYLAPLRLLAHEVWERINTGKVAPDLPPRACSLKTGEETQAVSDPSTGPFSTGLTSCTIEMASQAPVEVAVIDEIQMIADEQRGFAWTQALLGLQANEIHLCGEPSVVPLIKNIAEECGDQLEVKEYQRLTPLRVAESSLEGDLRKIRPGDCLVAFSRSGIFALKSRIEAMARQPGQPQLKCAVAYGNLPPEVKAEQARLFNEGVHANVMVASDAIGMGLNLKIKRIIFETCYKWNGSETVPLSASQIKQIAGRAGRYGTQKDDDGETGGVVTTMQEDDMPVLRAALNSPMRLISHASIQPSKNAAGALRAMLPEVPMRLPIDHWKVSKQERAAAEKKARSSPYLEDAVSSARTSKSRTIQTYSDIFTDMSLFCDVNSQNYYLSLFRQQAHIVGLVHAASDAAVVGRTDLPPGSSTLTIEERATFYTAPANTRDDRLVACLQSMVTSFAKGEIIDIKLILIRQGLMDPLEEIEALMGKLRERWLKSSKCRTDGNGVAQEATVGELIEMVPAGEEVPVKKEGLILFESLHRALSLYAWLSQRLPLSFCRIAEVEALKVRTELAIEFALEATRAGRKRRLQSLGRDYDREKDARRERRKQNRQKARSGRGDFVTGDRAMASPQRKRESIPSFRFFSTSARAALPRKPQNKGARNDRLSSGEREIHDLLTERFAPSLLRVQDVSGGQGTFYAVQVASKEFDGLSTVKQHRLVNECLKDIIGKLDGLQVSTGLRRR